MRGAEAVVQTDEEVAPGERPVGTSPRTYGIDTIAVIQLIVDAQIEEHELARGSPSRDERAGLRSP